MTKDIGILVAIPPDLKAWVDAQAEEIGLNAAIYIRMLVFAARKRRINPIGFPARESQPAEAPRFEARTLPAPQPAAYHQEVSQAVQPRQPVEYGEHGNTIDPDAWRGVVDDEEPGDSTVDVEAIINSRLAEADAMGLTAAAQQPYEAFGPPVSAVPIAGTRAVRRPLPGNGLLAPAGSFLGA